MVLRGSKISPETSLQDAEEAIRAAQEKLDNVKKELARAQSQTFNTLSDDVLLTMDRDKLISTVQELRDRVKFLEREAEHAESMYEETKQKMQETLTQFACGGMAGAIARTTVAPIDRVKIAMQTAAIKGLESKYTSVFGTARQIIKDEGFMRLWRGNLTNCIRVVPNTATQFMSYERYKVLLLGDDKALTVPKRLLAGALAGMTGECIQKQC